MGNRWRSLSVISLFLLVLVLPVLDSALDFDRAPQPNENRKIAVWPDWPQSLHALRTYCADVERYYNDHFGFRKQLIRWNNRWRKSFYRDLKGVDVIEGQNGWLYFTPGHVLDHLLGQRPFDAATLEALKQEFEARARWLAERNITYVMFVAPDKEAIYPEFLPAWLIPQIHQPSKLDQFLDYMRAHSKVPIVDVRPALMAAKTGHEVYLKTDSHWNNLGAYIATQAVLQRVAEQRPDFPAVLPYQELRMQVVSRHAGDAAGMIGRTEMQDGDWEIDPPQAEWGVPVQTDLSISEKQWPAGASPTLALNPLQKHRLVFFHDSFGVPMEKYLAWYFQRSASIFQYLWSYRDAPLSWSPEVVKREKPDVVIDEIVQRALLEITVDRVEPFRAP